MYEPADEGTFGVDAGNQLGNDLRGTKENMQLTLYHVIERGSSLEANCRFQLSLAPREVHRTCPSGDHSRTEESRGAECPRKEFIILVNCFIRGTVTPAICTV